MDGAKLEPRFCLIFIYRRSAVMRIEIRNVGGLRRVKRIINVVGTLGCPNSLFYFVNKEATMTNIQYSLFVSLLPLADHLSFLISTPRLFTPQTIKFNFMPCDTVVQYLVQYLHSVFLNMSGWYTLQLLPWFGKTINSMVSKT